MDVGVGDDATAGRLDGVDGGLRRQHGEDVERREDAALVGPVRVDVDDERRATGTVAGRGDGGDDGGDAAGVVPVPVRQEQHVDGGQVDGEPFGVGEPDVAVGADVEQDGCRAVAPSCGGECGEAVTGDAEMVEGDDAVVTVVLAARRDAPEQIRHFGKLRDAGAMLERVSVVLSTTIVMVSSSSSEAAEPVGSSSAAGAHGLALVEPSVARLARCERTSRR